MLSAMVKTLGLLTLVLAGFIGFKLALAPESGNDVSKQKVEVSAGSEEDSLALSRPEAPKPLKKERAESKPHQRPTQISDANPSHEETTPATALSSIPTIPDPREAETIGKGLFPSQAKPAYPELGEKEEVHQTPALPAKWSEPTDDQLRSTQSRLSKVITDLEEITSSFPR